MQRLVFVDLETSGATASQDRITEIGIILVDEHGVEEWSSLVNPETRISGFIESLTGISNEMVSEAPASVTLPTGSTRCWKAGFLSHTTPDSTMRS